MKKMKGYAILLTKLHYVLNHQMGPIRYKLKIKRCRTYHSSLLCPIVSYEENELLWIRLQNPGATRSCSGPVAPLQSFLWSIFKSSRSIICLAVER